MPINTNHCVTGFIRRNIEEPLRRELNPKKDSKLKTAAKAMVIGAALVAETATSRVEYLTGIGAAALNLGVHWVKGYKIKALEAYSDSALKFSGENTAHLASTAVQSVRFLISKGTDAEADQVKDDLKATTLTTLLDRNIVPKGRKLTRLEVAAMFVFTAVTSAVDFVGGVGALGIYVLSGSAAIHNYGAAALAQYGQLPLRIKMLVETLISNKLQDENLQEAFGAQEEATASAA